MTAKQLKKIVEKECQAVDNVVAISGGPMQPPPVSKLDGQDESASIIQFLVNENAQLGASKNWLRAAAALNWKRLQAGVAIEKRLKMPLNSVNRISQQLINAADAYTRAEMAEIAKQKLLGANPMEDLDPITIDGVRVDQPARVQAVNGGTVTVPPVPAAGKPKELPPPCRS